MESTVLALGALVFAAYVFRIVFQRTRVPDVLLLICVGLLLGPVTHLVAEDSLGRVGAVLSEVALVTLLFEGGTTLDLGVLARALRPTLRLTLVTFVLTALLTAAVGWSLLGLSPLAALMLGCAVGGSSSVVVIPLARGLGLGEKCATVLILESALTDVLCIVTVFALIDAAAQGGAAPLRVVGQIASSMLFAALLGALGGVAWMRVLPLVRRLPDTIFATVAFVFIVYGITQLLGYSGGIAALSFGVTLTNHERFEWIERLVRRGGAGGLATLLDVEQKFFGEIVFLLKTLFFLYLGLSIRFADARVLAAAFIVVASVYLARVVITARVADRDISVRDAALTSIMVPKGLAAAVLATVPLHAGVAGGEAIRDVTYAVVFFSIVLTSLLGWASERAPMARFYATVFGRFGGAPATAPAASAGAS